MPYCHRCGRELAVPDRFCPKCGATIGETTGTSAKQSFDSSSFDGRTGINALVGGAAGFTIGAMFAAVFTPFYIMGILAGGVLAGYLHAGGTTPGAKVGALSGLLATAPVVLLIFVAGAFGLLGLALGAGRQVYPMGAEFVGFGAVILLIVFFLFLVTLSNLLFGAVGGVIGDALGAETSRGT